MPRGTSVMFPFAPGIRGQRFFGLLGFLLLWIAEGVTAGQADTAAAVDAETSTVRLLMASEPSTLNSLRAADQFSAFLLHHIGEGLLQYDRDNQLAPALAERWEVDDAGARFWLRRDAHWEDGTPITAADFVYAWRELLRPSSGAPYAALLYAVRNARAITRGEMAVESLGVSAPDPHRLEISFAEPCAYFPALTAHMTLLPLPEVFHAAQGERYAADAGRLLASGPYRLTRWVHGAELVLEKNMRYWNARSIRIERIEIPYITSDTQAELNLFLDQRIALANVSGDSLGRVLAEHLQLRQFLTGYLEFISFNFRAGHVTQNLALRRAIQAAVDPDIVLNRVVRLPAARTTDSLFPSVLRGHSGRFVDEFPLTAPARGEAVARRLLEQARTELGISALPPIYLLTSDESIAVKVAEYLQARLAQVLGLDVRIDRQIFKQRLQKMNQGEYDLALANWSPDFDDPITFGDLFASTNPFNRGHYANAEYDAQVRRAQSTTDPATRLAALDQMQKLVVADVPIIPLYENARIYLQHPQLQGVVRAPFGGDPNLRYAWLLGP